MIVNPTIVSSADTRSLIAVTVIGENGDNVGGTVTLKLGNTTVDTATTDNNGRCSFFAETPGTYTVTYVKSSIELEDTVEVQYSGYTYELTLYIIYGKYWAVDIDIENSDPYTRCTYPQTVTIHGSVVKNNECYEYTPMAGSSSFTFTNGSWEGSDLIANIKPVTFDGTNWADLGTDAYEWAYTAGYTPDYFTEFPFYWLSITNDGTKIRVIFSDSNRQPDSTFQCYAHCKACDSYENADIEAIMPNVLRNDIIANNNNDYFANSFHIGCFLGYLYDSATKMTSPHASNSLTPTTDVVYGGYFSKSYNRGNEYDLMSFQQWTYLQALFILLFKSTNCQTSHSIGYSGSSVRTLSSARTNKYGMYGSTSSTSPTAFFWIHDLWGNIYQVIGGIFTRGESSADICYWLPRTANPRVMGTGWGNTYVKFTDLGTPIEAAPTSSYYKFYKYVVGTSNGGFLPTRLDSDSGTSTSYWSDYSAMFTSDSRYGYLARVGGCYSTSSADYLRNGLFRTNVDASASTYNSDTGARLAYRGGHI